MEAREKEGGAGGLLLAKSPTVISRTISFPPQHPGRGLGKVREEMELKSGGGEKERWLGSGKVAGEGPGRVVRSGLTGWKAAGRGEGQSHIFWKVLVFSKGVFLGIRSTRLRGSLLALTPAPSCRASRRELGFPRGPRRQAARSASLGGQACPACWEREKRAPGLVRAGSMFVLRDSAVFDWAKLLPASLFNPAWLRGWSRVSPGSGCCDGPPTSPVVARLLGTRGLQKEACPLTSEGEVGTFEPFKVIDRVPPESGSTPCPHLRRLPLSPRL